MKKIIVCDADGVLTLPEELFSIVYTKSHGLDPAPFERFFTTEWADFVTGKSDLKDHIRDNAELWQWSDTPDELVEYWCKTEDIRNEEMINLIKTLRSSGTPCYLATEQERYRGEYMKNVMFKDLFDGYFVTAEIGIKKSDPAFFDYVLKSLRSTHGDVSPKDVLFFDDSQSKVDAALNAGLDAILFQNISSAQQKLAQENLL